MWKNKLYLSFIFVILAVALLLPIAVLAQSKGGQSTTIPNPLGNTQDFPTLLKNISKAIMMIVLPFSVAGIIWSGFKFVTASVSGDPAKMQKAKQMLWWIIVGTVIIIGSSVLASAIVNFVKNL